MMDVMLISYNAPDNFWGGAFLIVCFFLQNRIPHKKTGKHPMSCGNVINLILNI